MITTDPGFFPQRMFTSIFRNNFPIFENYQEDIRFPILGPPPPPPHPPPPPTEPATAKYVSLILKID
jgi:hypothetical protein